MKKIKLKKAKYSDYKIIHSIRNEKQARNFSFRTGFIKLGDHKKWFKQHYKEYQIIIFEKKEVGYLRETKEGYISIAILPEYRGQKIGQTVLKKLKKGKASIKTTNKRSLSCFKKSGFKIAGYYLEKN